MTAAKFFLSAAKRGRVALLGIAQRTIRIKHAKKSRKDPVVKPLPESIKTIGDWIQVNRMAKNFTRCHLALKMGMATALIHSWEDGTSQPDRPQLEVLAKFFEIALPNEGAFSAPICPHEPEKQPTVCRTEIESQAV
jgi:ribosome-binding protein aMBF1 (putative translation factor)